MGQFKFTSLVHTLSTTFSRSYHNVTISASDIANGTADLAYYHFAIIDNSLTSCVTFLPPSHVPPGFEYNVRKSKAFA